MHHQQHKFWILPNTSLTRSFHAPPTAQVLDPAKHNSLTRSLYAPSTAQVLDPAKHKSHKITSCTTNSTSSGSCQTQVSQDHFMHHQQHKFWILLNTTVSQDHFMHHQQHKFWILPNTSLTRSFHAPPTAQVLDPGTYKSHEIAVCTTNRTRSGS